MPLVLKHCGEISHEDTIISIEDKARLGLIEFDLRRLKVQIWSCLDAVAFLDSPFMSYLMDSNHFIQALVRTHIVQTYKANVGLVNFRLICLNLKGLQDHNLVGEFPRNDTLKDIISRYGLTFSFV